MKISRAEQYSHKVWQLELQKQKDAREAAYQKALEKRTFDNIIAERVARNIRLDLDKGRNIDIEC